MWRINSVPFQPTPLPIFQNHCYLISFCWGTLETHLPWSLSTWAAEGGLRIPGPWGAQGETAPESPGKVAFHWVYKPMPHLQRLEGDRDKVYPGKEISLPSPYHISFLWWRRAAITVFPDDRNLALDLLFSLRLNKMLGAIPFGSRGRSWHPCLLPTSDSRPQSSPFYPLLVPSSLFVSLQSGPYSS